MSNVHQRQGRGTCKICERGSEGGGLCARHREAQRRLEDHFRVWEERLRIGWEDYLCAVAGSRLTGRWVREAAGHLLSEARAQAKK